MSLGQGDALLGLLATPLVLYLLVQALAVLIGREKQLAEEQVSPLNPRVQLTLLCLLLLNDSGLSGSLCVIINISTVHYCPLIEEAGIQWNRWV